MEPYATTLTARRLGDQVGQLGQALEPTNRGGWPTWPHFDGVTNQFRNQGATSALSKPIVGFADQPPGAGPQFSTFQPRPAPGD